MSDGFVYDDSRLNVGCDVIGTGHGDICYELIYKYDFNALQYNNLSIYQNLTPMLGK